MEWLLAESTWTRKRKHMTCVSEQPLRWHRMKALRNKINSQSQKHRQRFVQSRSAQVQCPCSCTIQTFRQNLSENATNMLEFGAHLHEIGPPLKTGWFQQGSKELADQVSLSLLISKNVPMSKADFFLPNSNVTVGLISPPLTWQPGGSKVRHFQATAGLHRLKHWCQG